MKKTTIFLGAASCCLMLSTGIHAQNHPTTPENGEIEIIMGDKSESPEKVYDILVENAPKVPEYVNLPRFAIVGKDKKFYMSIGASLKVTSSFDWGNPLNDPALFIPSNFTQAEPGNGGEFQFTVKRSFLSFNFVALPDTEDQLGVYINMNFTGNGNKYGASLKNAYVKYRGFTLGYKNTLYADGAASPYTIDSEGPNSAPGIWNTCFGYEHNFSSKIKGGLGLELPLYSVTSTNNSIYYSPTLSQNVVGKAKSVTQRIPDVPMYVQYKFNENGHIRLTGMIRNLQYRNINDSKNCDKVGWGAKISGLYNFGPIIAYWMGEYGRGIASYLQDNTGDNLDLVPSNITPGSMQMTKSWGAYAGLQFNLTKKLFSTLVYSHLRNYMDEYNGGDIKYGDQYQWGQYIAANMIYFITPNIKGGIEYLYGRRMNFDNSQLHDNRLMGMVYLSF